MSNLIIQTVRVQKLIKFLSELRKDTDLSTIHFGSAVQPEGKHSIREYMWMRVWGLEEDSQVSVQMPDSLDLEGYMLPFGGGFVWDYRNIMVEDCDYFGMCPEQWISIFRRGEAQRPDASLIKSLAAAKELLNSKKREINCVSRVVERQAY